MNNCGVSKNAGADEKRDERGRRLGLPVRVHELLGVSKSGGKIRNADGSMTENQRQQPMRIKDLLASMSSCKKLNPAARRMTVVPGGTINARRQLYDEKSDRTSPDKGISTTADLQASSHKSGLNGNTGSRPKSKPVQFLGISKSEGKNMKTNGHERRQPEKMKDFVASWEKSQTVKQQARKSMMGDRGTKNVRRKLYNNAPSPAAVPIITRKSFAPPKLESYKISTAGQRKSIKPEPKKSTQNQSRKSCLLPPNFIRDKHINGQHNETIKEESPASVLDELKDSESTKINFSKSQNAQNISETVKNSLEETFQMEETEKSPQNYESIFKNVKNSLEETFEIEETEKSAKNNLPTERKLELQNVWKNEEKKQVKDVVEVARPSVIMAAISIKKIALKSESSSPKSSESKKSSFTLSRPALHEIQRNSLFPQQRLDAMTSSFEDLLGNSRSDKRESFNLSNLPCNSFLDPDETSKKSLKNVDKQTLSWMQANLKLTIRSTEENLFSMKQMLRTLDDLIDENSTIDEETESRIKNRDDESLAAEKIGEKKSSKKDDLREISIITVTQHFENSENVDESEKNLLEKTKVEENKENVFGNENSKIKGKNSERRRSARLAAMRIGKSPKSADDSFSKIEKELNIFHDKSKALTPRAETPKERKKVDPRTRRSMREYMALKSMMNCLDTPDIKGLPTPKAEKDTPSQRRANKRTLSRQLLTELDDLYAESPQ